MSSVTEVTCFISVVLAKRRKQRFVDESSCQTVFKYGIAGKFHFSSCVNISQISGIVQM